IFDPGAAEVIGEQVFAAHVLLIDTVQLVARDVSSECEPVPASPKTMIAERAVTERVFYPIQWILSLRSQTLQGIAGTDTRPHRSRVGVQIRAEATEIASERILRVGALRNPVCEAIALEMDRRIRILP